MGAIQGERRIFKSSFRGDEGTRKHGGPCTLAEIGSTSFRGKKTNESTSKISEENAYRDFKSENRGELRSLDKKGSTKGKAL